MKIMSDASRAVKKARKKVKHVKNVAEKAGSLREEKSCTVAMMQACNKLLILQHKIKNDKRFIKIDKSISSLIKLINRVT